jgi:WD40 repeat protein
MATTAQTRGQSPYVGLNYYTEEDADIFFGRDVERRIVTANLRASRLTLLYAGSGVGKSSLIRAGVAARLRRDARSRHERGMTAYVPVVFSSWRDNPVQELIGEIESAVKALTEGQAAPLPRESLEVAIKSATDAIDGTLLIILDQFEEYFLYKDKEAKPGRLARHVARCVGRTDLRANFLIAVREDAYAGVGDLFKGRIDNVYGNFLHLEYLNPLAARDAIEEPIEWYNKLHPDAPAGIEPELVDAVIRQVRAGQHFLEQSGQGRVSTSNGESEPDEQVETPYLQLVMTTLWDAEAANGHHLQLKTFRDDLGGAQRIVGNHLDDALGDLSDEERATAADFFQYLVTPSGRKITYPIDDLVKVTGRPAAVVQSVIDKLTGDRRILKPLPGPSGEEDKPRVEIFHDVLAPAILDWRTRQVAEHLRQETERLEREKQTALQRAKDEQERAQLQKRLADEERARARRFKRLAFTALGLMALLICVGAVVYAFAEAASEHRAQDVAESRAVASEATASYQSGATLGRGLLLSIEAYRDSSTAQARAALVGGLVKTAGMEGYLKAHSAPVNKVAFDPAAPLVASASVDHTVVVWDYATGRQQSLPAGTGAINSVAFSPTGLQLASAGDDGNVILWDLSTPTGPVSEGPTLSADVEHVYDVAYNRAGTLLASGNSDGSVTVWNPTTDGRDMTLPGNPAGVNAVAFDPTANALAAAYANGPVVVWNLATHRAARTLRGATAPTSIAFSPDGRIIAAGDVDGTVKLWNASTGGRLGPLAVRGDTDAIEGVAFSPDGSEIASGGNDGFVRLWSTQTGALLRTYQGHTATVESVAFSSDGRMIASGSDDESVILWDASLEHAARVLTAGGGPQLLGIAVSPTGNLLAAANAADAIDRWQLPNGTPLSPLPTVSPVEKVAFSPVGSLVAAALSNGSVELFDAGSGKFVRTLPGSGGPAYSVVFGPDGLTVAAGESSGDVLLWNVRTGRQVGRLSRPTGAVYGVAFSPDGTTLASADSDGSVAVWDLRANRLLHTLVGHTAAVEAVQFSPSGSVLASASEDDNVILWNPKTGKQIGDPLSGHQATVWALAFSPNGKTLVSGSSDHTVIVWNLRTRLGQPLEEHTNLVTGVAFTPNGRILASSGEDGTVVLDSSLPMVDSVAAIDQRLCGIARTNLTSFEWRELLPGQPYHRTCTRY